MDLFSFTTIIVILFIIVGSYLLLTTEIEGRAKTVLIVSVVVAFIIIFINLPIFKSFSEGVSSPTATTTESSITSYEVTTSYSLSMWIYISDWNDSLGKYKVICIRQLISEKINPLIYLDQYNNTLKITFYTIAQTDSAVPKLNDISIDDIEIQKWVNIVVCFGDNKVDTYINGKLEKTTICDNPQYVDLATLSTNQPFKFTPPIVNNDQAWSTYTGFISKTQYYSKFLSPQEVWDIYKAGYSDNMWGDLLNKYNAAFVFYENQNEKAKFYLM